MKIFTKILLIVVIFIVWAIVYGIAKDLDAGFLARMIISCAGSLGIIAIFFKPGNESSTKTALDGPKENACDTRDDVLDNKEVINMEVTHRQANMTVSTEIDPQYFALAEQEIDELTFDKGLWALALANANGKEELRKIEYMKLRAWQLHEKKLLGEAEQRQNEIEDQQIHGNIIIQNELKNKQNDEQIEKNKNYTTYTLIFLSLISWIVVVLVIVTVIAY